MTVIAEEILAPTEWQRRVLQVPEVHDVILAGGRGSGKSRLLLYLAVQHVTLYGRDARPLYARRSFPGIRDFEAQCREVLPAVFPGASYNAQSHVWKLGGATFELAEAGDWSSLEKHQGRSVTLLLFDELQAWSDLTLPMRLLSNLRGAPGVPLRMVAACNPGGLSHGAIFQRFIAGTTPWEPRVDDRTGRSYVWAPSTWRDNERHVGNDYPDRLRASTSDDPELLRGSLENDWAIARGAFFANTLSDRRSAIDPWEAAAFARARDLCADPSLVGWYARRKTPWATWPTFLCYDHGSSAPAVAYLAVVSDGGEGPDGRFYPRGSVILVDEFVTVDHDDLNRGTRATVPELAREILGLARRWGVSPAGVADDAIFSRHGSSSGSIGDEFLREGIEFRPAGKADRASGWSRMRALLSQAGEPDLPGLYISRSCRYAWETLPTLPRDPRRPDDVDSRAADHAADAIRYGCIAADRWTGDNVGVSSLDF